MTQLEIETNYDTRSTPGSDNYGKHMTSDEIIDFFAPHTSAVDVVMEWLVESGIAAERIGVSVNKQVSN